MLKDHYVIKNHKKLYFGYTTGSCAAAAAKGSTYMLLTGEKIHEIQLMTPKGIELTLKLLDIQIMPDGVSCAVEKYSGDDPDVTDGIWVYAKVSKNNINSIRVDSGLGVGRVTKKGLEQPVGHAAINKVPRKMMIDNVMKVCEDHAYSDGLDIEITIPQGVEIAKKTFNPYLGIEGGISVLGTSGIVEPMSESALIESIRIEMNMKVVSGYRDLVMTPGNYGTDFALNTLNISPEYLMKCSNYIGETLDMAIDLGVENILFISHIGKFIKLAGGIMNTHSAHGDARLELLAIYALKAGVDRRTALKVLECLTTDEAIDILLETPYFESIMTCLLERMMHHINRRTGGLIHCAIVLFTNSHGILGRSSNFDAVIKQIQIKSNPSEKGDVI